MHVVCFLVFHLYVLWSEIGIQSRAIPLLLTLDREVSVVVDVGRHTVWQRCKSSFFSLRCFTSLLNGPTLKCKLLGGTWESCEYEWLCIESVKRMSWIWITLCKFRHEWIMCRKMWIYACVCTYISFRSCHTHTHTHSIWIQIRNWLQVASTRKCMTIFLQLR